MQRLLNYKMKAVLLTKTTREIVTRPVPVPAANEVLIKGKSCWTLDGHVDSGCSSGRVGWVEARARSGGR